MESVDLNRHAKWLAKADILTDALPFMRRYNGQSVVIKYGGHAMGDAELAAEFAADMVLIKQVGMHPVVVHGGGPQIGAMLERLAIKSDFVDGLRITDQATVEIVEMVLAGSINKAVVAAINQAGGSAVGLSGKDAGLIQARRLTRTSVDPDSQIEKVLDLGFVGEPAHVDVAILKTLAENRVIPVVAPIGLGAAGETFNINADTAAGAISAAMGATRLLMLTDVSGVLNKDGEHIQKLKITQARALIADGTINGGMIPKVETCIDAVEGGAEAAVILDGRERHAVLVELFTEHGIGTIITKD